MIDKELYRISRLGLQEFSLPIRRFTKSVGASHPIEAVEIETTNIIKKYRKKYGFTIPISLKWICDFLDIEVIGKVPEKTHKTPYYSSYARNRTLDFIQGQLFIKNGKPYIKLPTKLDLNLARVVVAHEVGHWIISRKQFENSHNALRRGSSLEEEYLSDYAARRLLIPDATFYSPLDQNENLSFRCMLASRRARATLYSATIRLGDKDIWSSKITCAILWHINPKSLENSSNADRLTPQWFCGSNEFIPVGKCRARNNSLIADLAGYTSDPCFGNRIEEVNIGELKGQFNVSAFAWGSMKRGTRLVLSIFYKNIKN